MKKSMFTLGISLLVLTGCSETTAPQKVEPEEVVTEEVAAPETFKVGDTVEIGDVAVKINEVYKHPGSEFDVPTKDAILVFDVSVTNTGTEPYAISSLMSFTLNADGRSQDIYLLSEQNGQLDGDIAAGKTMSGELAYDVTETDSYELIFTDDPFSDAGQATFEIPSSDIK